MLGEIGGFQAAPDLSLYITNTYLTTNYISIANMLASAQAPAVIGSQFPQVAGVYTFTDFSDRRFWMPINPTMAHTTPIATMAFGVGGSLQITGGVNNQDQHGQCGVMGRFNIVPDAGGIISLRITFNPCNFPIITFGADAAVSNFWGMFLYSRNNFQGAGVYVTPAGGTNQNKIAAWNGDANAHTVNIATPITGMGVGVNKPAASAIVEVYFGEDTNGGAWWFGIANVKYNVDGAGLLTAGSPPGSGIAQNKIYGFTPFLGAQFYGRVNALSATLTKFEVMNGICI